MHMHASAVACPESRRNSAFPDIGTPPSQSLCRGTQWAVFEANDETLWAQLRPDAGTFVQSLFRQGAFQSTSPREAYFVTQADIDAIVTVIESASRRSSRRSSSSSASGCRRCTPTTTDARR